MDWSNTHAPSLLVTVSCHLYGLVKPSCSCPACDSSMLAVWTGQALTPPSFPVFRSGLSSFSTDWTGPWAAHRVLPTGLLHSTSSMFFLNTPTIRQALRNHRCVFPWQSVSMLSCFTHIVVLLHPHRCPASSTSLSCLLGLMFGFSCLCRQLIGKFQHCSSGLV